MDKLHEENRKQFEEWFLSEMEIDVSEMRNDDPSTSAEWPYTTGADESSLVITVASNPGRPAEKALLLSFQNYQESPPTLSVT